MAIFEPHRVLLCWSHWLSPAGAVHLSYLQAGKQCYFWGSSTVSLSVLSFTVAAICKVKIYVEKFNVNFTIDDY